MRRHWIAISPLTTVRDALPIMRLGRLRQLPVVADGILCGVISYGALVEAAAAEGSAPIRQVMAPEMETGDACMPLAEAAARIARSRAGCLPVVEASPEGPRLIGLVTECDLLRVAYEPVRSPAPG